ncbi:MAG: lysophospholipid acyltransferase family protein [candidate division KSB1 bacterium]|jgi:lysophospholipid acyltransferase (LPLAT)-like uncharacterized protein|nr:lysophospholipid acyltransferase family protein [candidate division KSB1 bacterium]
MNKKTKKRITFFLVAKFGWLFILLLGKLSFVKLVGLKHLRRVKKEGAPLIYVLWHGRIMLPIYIHRNQGITAMVSLHDDGEMISQAVHRLGYKTVRGSSTRGGKEAFYKMLDVLKNGGECTIMPDGPRGPRHKLKPGALFLAQQSGAYILPLSFRCKHPVEFKSWDRFNLITPFSRSVAVYGEPIRVPRELSEQEIEFYTEKIEQGMIENEKRADAYFN